MKKEPKSIKNLEKKIKANNEAFRKMTKREKRIAIAKDVISSIKSHKFIPKPGVYMELVFGNKQEIKERVEEKNKLELQNLLLDNSIETCNVCAIGSIFASRVCLGNSFKIDGDEIYSYSELILNDDDMLDSLKSIFNEKQLREIEFAFEGDDITGFFYLKPDKFHEKYTAFYDKYNNSSDRMIAIMKNIIKNEGEFKI